MFISAKAAYDKIANKNATIRGFIREVTDILIIDDHIHDCEYRVEYDEITDYHDMLKNIADRTIADSRLCDYCCESPATGYVSSYKAYVCEECYHDHHGE